MRGRSQISKELVTSAARVTIALRVEKKYINKLQLLKCRVYSVRKEPMSVSKMSLQTRLSTRLLKSHRGLINVLLGTLEEIMIFFP